jgi:hypothetical protein
MDTVMCNVTVIEGLRRQTATVISVNGTEGRLNKY